MGGGMGTTPVASPAAWSSPAPDDSPVATASREYAAKGRFAWERIGAAYLRVTVARFGTPMEAAEAFAGFAEQRREEAGGVGFVPVAVRSFADQSTAWAGFDDEERPAALLVVREGRDVHGWVAWQVAHAGRTPNPADPLNVLIRIATSVFAVSRPEPETALAALPGSDAVPAGLEPFAERQILATPSAPNGGRVDGTPAL